MILTLFQFYSFRPRYQSGSSPATLFRIRCKTFFSRNDYLIFRYIIFKKCSLFEGACQCLCGCGYGCGCESWSASGRQKKSNIHTHTKLIATTRTHANTKPIPINLHPHPYPHPQWCIPYFVRWPCKFNISYSCCTIILVILKKNFLNKVWRRIFRVFFFYLFRWFGF